MLQLKSLHATGHTGRETTEVGLRKQQRHLKDLGKLYVLYGKRKVKFEIRCMWQPRHLKPLITFCNENKAPNYDNNAKRDSVQGALSGLPRLMEWSQDPWCWKRRLETA